MTGGLCVVTMSGCASAPPAGAASVPTAAESLGPGMALATFDTVWTVVARTYVDTGFVATKWKAVRDSLRPRATSVMTRVGLDRLLEVIISLRGGARRPYGRIACNVNLLALRHQRKACERIGILAANKRANTAD